MTSKTFSVNDDLNLELHIDKVFNYFDTVLVRRTSADKKRLLQMSYWPHVTKR